MSIVLPFPSMYMNTWANYYGWPIKNSHSLGPMEGIIIMVGQSKIVIFLAPWKGLLLLSLANQKNIHFLGPMEGIIIIMVGQSKKHSFSRPRGEYWSILGMFTTQTKRPTFDGVECSKCLGTNLDSFEAN